MNFIKHFQSNLIKTITKCVYACQCHVPGKFIFFLSKFSTISMSDGFVSILSCYVDPAWSKYLLEVPDEDFIFDHRTSMFLVLYIKTMSKLLSLRHSMYWNSTQPRNEKTSLRLTMPLPCTHEMQLTLRKCQSGFCRRMECSTMHKCFRLLQIVKY